MKRARARRRCPVAESSIEWTDRVWNPVVGCTPVSPGCLNCYAARMAVRLEAMKVEGYGPRVEHTPERLGMPDAFGTKVIPAETRTVRIAEVRGANDLESGGGGGRPVFTGDVRLMPEKLGEPLKWRKPCRVFVNSMSDLFHEAVPDEFIRLVMAAMSFAGQHTFQVLTKRPERMAAWFADPANSLSACQAEWVAAGISDETPTGKHRIGRCGSDGSINGTCRGVGDGNHWPLPNVWLGTSVENQAAADERVPKLLRCPGRLFLSCEPLLERVDLSRRGWLYSSGLRGRGRVIEWVIAGGESGPEARACNIEHLRSLRDQCREVWVPFFLKQLGARPVLASVYDTRLDWPEGTRFTRCEGGPWGRSIVLKDKKGGDPAEWPEDLRVREMPEVR